MEAAIDAMITLVDAAKGGPLLLEGKVSSGSALDTAMIRKETELSKCSFVDISNNDLGEAPAALFRLRNLTEAKISGNKIARLPEICLWENLTVLDLSENCLTEIHPLLFLQTKLVELNVRSNLLSTLPMLPDTVVRILASNNKLTALSPNLELHTCLEVLELAGNELDYVPFADMELPKLKSLDLRNNKLKTLPAQLAEYGAIEQLEIAGNPLEESLVVAGNQGIESLVTALRKGGAGTGVPKKGVPNRPEGIIDGLVESISTPGVNPGVIKAGYIIFGTLIFFDVVLFIALGPSIHVLALFLLSVGLFGSMQWFIGALVEAQEEHDRKLAVEAENEEADGGDAQPEPVEGKKDK